MVEPSWSAVSAENDQRRNGGPRSRPHTSTVRPSDGTGLVAEDASLDEGPEMNVSSATAPVSYTHLRAHETVLDLVCRLLLEKNTQHTHTHTHTHTQKKKNMKHYISKPIIPMTTST